MNQNMRKKITVIISLIFSTIHLIATNQTTSSSFRIGIDIGGTNTDGVIVDGSGKIITSAKTITTPDITEGFRNVIEQLFKKSSISTQAITGIFIGTTHATNAILQRSELLRVGVIRIAGQQPDSIPCCFEWPEDIKKKILVKTITVDGGFECDGSPITAMQADQIKKATEDLLKAGAQSIAIIGVFAPMKPEQELEAEKLIKKINSNIPISLSHQIGGIGFIERENSTILNAALKKVVHHGFHNIEHVCRTIGLNCPLWVIQNNGSVITLEHAMHYPVLTISSGPTNSFIGGTKLLGLKNAIVIDIGGTSTDAGVVINGCPRRRIKNSVIGGIHLNFQMPDVNSIALGGGSCITITNDKTNQSVTIEPQSVGQNIKKDSVAFGGSNVTLTDVALLLNKISIEGADVRKISLSSLICSKIVDHLKQKLTTLIKSLGVNTHTIPIIIIGGGAKLIAEENLEVPFVIPPYADVANAYGAALADIAATIDTTVSLEDREKTLNALRTQVIEQAIKRGADEKSVTITDMQIIPYNYAPQNMSRVIITASGHQKDVVSTPKLQSTPS